MQLNYANNGKVVYSVKRLFTKEEMLEFNDKSLSDYKRLSETVKVKSSEVKESLQISVVLSLVLIFSLTLTYLIQFGGYDGSIKTAIFQTLFYYIVPCIILFYGIMNFSQKKEIKLNTVKNELTKLKEDQIIASSNSIEDIEFYLRIIKKLRGFDEKITFYDISDYISGENHRQALAILDTTKSKWSILEYTVEGCKISSYYIYDITEDSNIVLDWA